MSVRSLRTTFPLARRQDKSLRRLPAARTRGPRPEIRAFPILVRQHCQNANDENSLEPLSRKNRKRDGLDSGGSKSENGDFRCSTQSFVNRDFAPETRNPKPESTPLNDTVRRPWLEYTKTYWKKQTSKIRGCSDKCLNNKGFFMFLTHFN